MKGYSISLYFDTRRAKKNGKYPLKLRVFCLEPKIQKLYATVFEFTKEEYSNIFESTKPRNENKTIKLKAQALENKAESIAESIVPFDFELFEKKLFSKNQTKLSVLDYFDEVINNKKALDSISTSEKYSSAKTSFINYRKENNIKGSFLFKHITVDFLKGYENFYIKKGFSKATIGIYVRNLRAVYRLAIKDGAVNIDCYPFGVDKYKIPTSNKVNKALTEEQIKKLWQTTPKDENEAKAKCFWFFSYFCYGMNIKDICNLKHSDLHGSYFTYVRAKTKNTIRDEVSKRVHITKNIQDIIEKYKDDSSTFLFGLINEKDSAIQKHNKIKAFTKFINKYFRRVVEASGEEIQFANEIGTYHARHSFATISIRKGNSLEFISEILHDGNLQTTQQYLNSFPKESYSKLSEALELV